MSPGQMVAILTAAAGGPPELWERQVSIGYIQEQFRACAAQLAAEKGGALADSHVASATRQLGLAAEAIRARAQQEAAP
jgi:(p)ppGpp synthase/HD superfamily hydrolase